MAEDPWSRVDYRRLVRWPERIEREWPFLSVALAEARGPIVDLGCGTGEHSRFLAAQGYDVIGIDRSPAMLARATETPLPSNLQFIEGDIADVAALVDRPVGGAICLGNALPHLDEEHVTRLLGGLASRLVPDGPFVLQIVNYERVFGTGLRHLPLNILSGDDGETVFLRLMTPRPDGIVVFNPTTLRYVPEGDPPVRVVSTRTVHLHGWQRPEIEARLRAAGFDRLDVFGAMDRAPYAPLESQDLIVVARLGRGGQGEQAGQVGS
jgi:SAM-dependent methyltransferase